ncbi:MAG: nucleoside monophosphate kinase [Candidatus Paceibacterota bacterium]
MDPQTFIFAGPSGSGKGTQVEKLKGYLAEQSEHPQLHISTGAEFRQFRKEKSETYTAKISNEVDLKGGLQPCFLAIWAWSDALIERFTGQEHLLFDGSPRTISEAHSLDAALNFYGRDKAYVLLVNVSREESKRRLMERGRSDDTESAIENRLDWYESQVKPALEEYRGNDRYSFHEINGERSVEEVHKEIIRSLSLTE